MKIDLTKSNNMSLMNDIINKPQDDDVALTLPVEQIDYDPDNKEVFTEGKIKEIAESIKEVGFTGAIEVFQKKDGRYQIIAGETRYRANLLVGNKTIRAIVTANIKEEDRVRRFLGSNLLARDLTPYDYANVISYYKEHLFEIDKAKEKEEGNSLRFRDVASKYLNMSASSVYRYECILRCIPELKAYAKDKTFPYNTFEKICTLSEEEQYVLYDRIKEYINFCNSFKPEDAPSITDVKIRQMISAVRKDLEKREKEKKKEKREVKPQKTPKIEIIAPKEDYADELICDYLDMVADAVKTRRIKDKKSIEDKIEEIMHLL